MTAEAARPLRRLPLADALSVARDLGLPVAPVADEIAGLAIDVTLKSPAELFVETWAELGYNTALDGLRAEDADAVLAALDANDRDADYREFALAVGAQCRLLGAMLSAATGAAYIGTSVLEGVMTLEFGPASDAQPCPAALAGRGHGDWSAAAG